MSEHAVELRLPLDGDRHRIVVPDGADCFVWCAAGIGPGTDPYPATDSRRWHRLQTTLLDVTDRLSCSLTIDGEDVPLVTEFRRDGDRRERAFWTLADPVADPVSATVALSSEGATPTVAGDPVTVRPADGPTLPWGETRRTEIELLPSGAAEEFSTRTDGLWDDKTVVEPRVVTDRSGR